jgi:hypothetical protein
VTSLTHFKNAPSQRWSSLDESWRLAITIFVIARLLYGIWSWVVFTIQPVAIQNMEFSGEPILSVFMLKNSRAFIYDREVNGKVLTFHPIGSGLIVDQQTGTVWNPSNGQAIQGPNSGVTLSPAKTNASEIISYPKVVPYPGIWLAMWQRFDANWYISIAENGYGSIPGDVHFPPLYPLLIRFLQPFFHNAFLGGLFLSHLTLVYSLKLLYGLFLQWGDRETARRAMVFFAIYPTFFFCFSAYTEPIFLVTALLSFRSMSNRSWHWAGFWLFCSILIRLQGVALLAPLCFLMWRDPPFLRKPGQWIGLLIAGTGGLVYLYLRSTVAAETTLPFAETNLHARLVLPWQSYWYAVQTLFSGYATFIDFLNWGTATLFTILILWGWKKIPLEYNIYTAASMLIILTRVVETQPLVSLSRYSLTFFPVFFTLAITGKQPWTRRVIVYTSILLSLYLSGQFFLWGWVA